MTSRAWVLVGTTLAGCSLLYNPNNLPEQRVDALPTDVNLEDPTLISAGPPVLFEGQGADGSRRAVLAIVGGNLGPDAVVSLVPTTPRGPDPMIEVDNLDAVRSPSGSGLAVPITLPVDPDRGNSGAADIPLTIQVTQMGAHGPIMRALAGQVVLRNLPELTMAVTSSAALAPLYARVMLSGGLTFAPGGPAALIRAVGSIDIAGDIQASAGGQQPGPGGGAGGAKSSGGGGDGGGRPEGGAGPSGGGYGTMGGQGTGLLGATTPGGAQSGDEFITSYLRNSSGGGGGGSSLGSVVGGGGGGTVELSAGGTLSVGKVTVNGASAGGSGGSGGAIVLRAGSTATLKGDLTAVGAGGSGNAGGGAQGRVRYDAPSSITLPTIAAATMRRGVAFDTAGGTNPLIATHPRPSFNVVGAPSPGVMFNLFVLDAGGDTIYSGTFMFGSSTAVISPGADLRPGYNRVCVTPPMGTPDAPSANCIYVAYVP